jgi:diguanylate cyclase (GGDEF)-like protein
MLANRRRGIPAAAGSVVSLSINRKRQCVLRREIYHLGAPVELFRQNLAVESDLQGFSGFVLESVARLNGNTFAATPVLLDLMRKLRAAGAASGYPVAVALSLDQTQLRVSWNNHSEQVVNLAHAPSPDEADRLHRYLQDSTLAIDPEVLLQRNAEMMRHFEETRARNERELAALQQALENGRADLEKLSHQAETDPLTGLYNRRAFDARLEQLFRHTMRQKKAPLSLLMLDLDYFKQVNDEHGHQYGDAYLIKMAQVLRSIIREDVDFAFRFGGDEFAVVLYADHPQALDKAEQVLTLMERRVSIGITTINENTPEGLPLEEFIRHADHALYEAKRCGRGRAVVELHSAIAAPSARKHPLFL